MNLSVLDFFPDFLISCVSKVECKSIQGLIRLYRVLDFKLLFLQRFKCVVIAIGKVSYGLESKVTLESFTLLQKQIATNAFTDSSVQFVNKWSKVISSLLLYFVRNIFIEVFLNIHRDVLILREIISIVGLSNFWLDGKNLT